jgi:hypothetical protein
MMHAATPQPVTITVDDTRAVSGLLQAPRQARVCSVLAHGAGAGMSHPFMVAVADGLAMRGIASLRYQFPYMEQGSKRPDAPKLAEATVRAAIGEASRLVPKLALVAGGKSFGGRMTSQAQAASPLPGGSRAGVSRLPAACRRASVGGARQAFVRGCRSDAVLAGNARCTCRHHADAAPHPRARPARNSHAVSGCRSFFPCARAQRTQRCRNQSRNAGCVGSVDLAVASGLGATTEILAPVEPYFRGGSGCGASTVTTWPW